MSRSTVALRFALAAFAAGIAPPSSLALAAQQPGVSSDSRAQDDALYTVEELDNLLAPVALYPDPILAQLFVAATYPDQIALAARFVETYGSNDVDDQSWDVSVRAIARYGPVLNMLAERPNWATAVGRAYAMQPGDVMASVQSLRRLARAQGNLESSEQQRVEVEREYIRIVPAQPRVIYVPVYDPYVIYYRPVNYIHVESPYWSFGIGHPIGAWLNYDLDWDTRVVYYHGWNGHGRRHTWYHVSRPYISYNSIYIDHHYTVIAINHSVRHRYVNYGGFDYYNTVHRNTHWNRPQMPGRGGYASRPGRTSQPDRYGVPANGGSTYRPDKSDGNNAVPRVGGSAGSGSVSSGRASRGGNGNPSAGNGNSGRGNGNGNGTAGRGNGNTNGGGDIIADRGNRSTPRTNASRLPVAEDRVKPVRVGGNDRPLYPRGEDISSERARDASPVARREAGSTSGGSNGTWNARTPDRSQARPSSAGASAGGSRGRDADPVRAPRYESPRAERSTPRYESPRAERSTPRYEAPRAERSAPRFEAPRAERSTPRYEAPRSQPRAERSAPSSSPRASAPRASAPRENSAPRSSAPRASAPRGGSSGSVPRAPRSGGRDGG